MSRVTELIKRRRTSRRGWRRRALGRVVPGDVRSPRVIYYFGTGTLYLLTPDGSGWTKVGMLTDVTFDFTERT